MSALAKPMIHTLAVDSGQSDMVNADYCKGVSAVDVDAVPGINQQGRYTIEFAMGESGSGTPNNITWTFALEATRDAEMVKVLNTISTVVV